MASSKVMNPGWSSKQTPPPLPITTPPLPELVLVGSHISYQGARVLMEAEGREGESEGDHGDSQSHRLLWITRKKGAEMTPGGDPTMN